MMNKYTSTSLTVMAVAMTAAISLQAMAETVTTKTVVTNQELENVNTVDFASFDVNGDGSFSMVEVGERLFKSFDKDGNGHIDNLEWDNKSVMTISPMEKQTFQYVDHDNDGLVDETTYTYETFYQASGLARFDDNKNGLSAKEFIGTTILELDKNDDYLVSIDEWKDGYIASIKPESLEEQRYNR